VGLGIDASFDFAALNSCLLLNSEYQTDWDEGFGKFADN